ncbi:DUF4145 domain-containing protein [Bremerella sp. P1]|uniref:DUF4145 domain-containing protein n=1 Tax=Bremerella sp. P1 TaxID=3026424 RepID=UPI0023685F08|nr:DUF4145 domain-containing protein [Bremerella sp. P1]WDI41813.1 hypothetical protein PSR63_25510 [Bremerella sp. P1]
MIDRVKRRFEQLAATAEEIEDSKDFGSDSVPSNVQSLTGPTRMTTVRTYLIDLPKVLQWYSSVRTLLVQVFGDTSPLYTDFERKHDGTRHEVFDYRKAVFFAAKDDYENGFANLRELISADVFSDELEQAEELLAASYKTPAAVVAGTVLETTIRSLCGKHGIQNDRRTKLDTMNSELAKAGEYNKTKADQVRAWAKIRNSAAHGHADEFTETDVKLMIEGVRDFVANQLS